MDKKTLYFVTFIRLRGISDNLRSFKSTPVNQTKKRPALERLQQYVTIEQII